MANNKKKVQDEIKEQIDRVEKQIEKNEKDIEGLDQNEELLVDELSEEESAEIDIMIEATKNRDVDIEIIEEVPEIIEEKEEIKIVELLPKKKNLNQLSRYEMREYQRTGILPNL